MDSYMLNRVSNFAKSNRNENVRSNRQSVSSSAAKGDSGLLQRSNVSSMPNLKEFGLAQEDVVVAFCNIKDKRSFPISTYFDKGSWSGRPNPGLALAPQPLAPPRPGHTQKPTPQQIWDQVCLEARENVEREPILASQLHASILQHTSLAQAVAFILAQKLGDQTLLAPHLNTMILDVLMNNNDIMEALVSDLVAVRERDPACLEYSQPLLFFKGFQALQTYRLAHHLWNNDRKPMATAIHHRAAQKFAVDIHPAAKVGKGVLFDHATGVVVGETAEIGDNVSILHRVSLAASGNGQGRRHPKIGDGVLIGAGVVVVGPVTVGTGSKIGAGAVVVTDVPEHSVAVGVPARVKAINELKQKDPGEDMCQTLEEFVIHDFMI